MKTARPRPDAGYVYRLFVAALDLQEGMREQFLARECSGDLKSRAEVEDLLRFATGDANPTRALLPMPAPQLENLLGRVYGRFRLVELIGEGGMGVVYRAERTDGVKQNVALKLASRTVAAAAQLRFESEAQLLARLEHPAVARLIDAGVEDGRAWIAMEFVRGERIDKYCRHQGLGTREIVALITQLADAVSAAHRLLVVHSDIKPANVLVTQDGTPKLIDFGIATAAREADASPEPATRSGRLFSSGFAAPEQVSGDGVTVATDVFGLGALAYHLLSGRPPHGAEVSALSYSIAVSTRDVLPASQSAAAAGRDPAEIRLLRGDLDAILSKALARSPLSRYASAADLRADFARYLAHRPVRARQASLSYRMRKFTRRNFLACVFAAVSLASVIAGGAMMLLHSQRETAARNMAARRDELLESLLKSADPRGGRRDISVAELLDQAASQLDGKLAKEPLVEASMLGVIAQTDIGLGRYAEGLVANDRQLLLLRSNSAGNVELGQALSLRGELLREEGKWHEAEPVLREAVALLRPNRASAEYCQALWLFGVVQQHAGQEENSLQTLQQVIDIASRGDPKLQQKLMMAYHAMAVGLANLGRYAQALVYARDAVSLARQSLPGEHPDLLSLETTYAGALVNVHRYEEAEALYRRVIAKEIRVLGTDHKDTLLAQLMLADELLELDRDAEAVVLAGSVAERLDPLLGADNLYTQIAWQEYGSATCNDGRIDAGLDILRRVDAAWHRLLPSGDRLVQASGLSIGKCLSRAERYGEAETALLNAAAGLEAARGPAYRRTQEAYRALRDLYITTARNADASYWTAKLIQDR